MSPSPLRDPSIDFTAVRRVLVVKCSSFGDIVHVTPCLRALRQTCPNAEILAVIDRVWAPLLRHDPHIDGIVEADPERRKFISSWIDARRHLRARGGVPIDLAIDFQGLRRSAAWVYASGARWRTGRGVPRPGWHIAVRPQLEQHAVQVCAEIVQRLGIPLTDLEPRLFVAPEADHELEQLLRAAGVPPRGFILANPFGRWRAKMWPVERWSALLDQLRRDLRVSVVITGGPDEAEASARLVARLAAPVPSFAGRTSLAQALALYRRAALVISGDSGPMHAAAALGTPVVALFGATWPERSGPWGPLHRVIQRSRAASHAAYREDSSHQHIEAIDVDTVFDTVAALYDQLRSPATRASVASIRET